MKLQLILTLFLAVSLVQSQSFASESKARDASQVAHASGSTHTETKDEHKAVEHNDQDGDEVGHGHTEKQSTHIKSGMASKVGIVTAQATSHSISQSIIVYGSLTTAPEQLSHVRARYSGLIKSVRPTIGDVVKRGDLLAEVESNESLKNYSIRAPIGGTIIQRHANTGEVTQEQVLFSIANFDSLWAELRIYPSQQSLVKVGQPAHIDVNERELGGVIQHIIPALDKPYQLARVKIDNQALGLAPGLLVEGHIVTGEFTAKQAVEKVALQILGNQQGVFVQQGDEYEFTPLRLGRSDNRYVEVLAGLSPGQRYVSENSYLIKADIEKSEAEHQH